MLIMLMIIVDNVDQVGKNYDFVQMNQSLAHYQGSIDFNNANIHQDLFLYNHLQQG